MAYRVAPMLGAYREAPLLGTLFTQAKAYIAAQKPLAQTAVIPKASISSPTMIVAPAAVPPPVIVPLQPSVFTEAPNVLPMPPIAPTPAGSSPMSPAGGGGGGGGGGGVLYPDGSVSSAGAAVEAPTAAKGTTPGWILPAAAAGVLLFMLSRKH